MIKDHESVDVFIGVDVGKTNHHAVALDRNGKKLLDKALPQDEAKLRAIIDSLTRHGTLLLVVDQPATIGALPVAVAQAAGILVGYLPGLAMRRIADLHPGEAKTDARDAYIIAEAARTMPHTLRSIAVADEQVAELSMLCGFDDDLAKQATAASNRIRGLLTQIHPALERVVGPHLDHPVMAELLRKYPTPEALRKAGQTRVGAFMAKLAPRAGKALGGRDLHRPGRADRGRRRHRRRRHRAAPAGGATGPAAHLPRTRSCAQVEELVEAHPLHPVLTSMPAVGVRTAARILTEVVGKDFTTAGHLGLLRRPRPGDLALRNLDPRRPLLRKGNKILKRAFFLSAFAALKDPVSRAYYDRKRAEGKRHNQALIALARRRCDVLFAMLRDGTLYDAPRPETA